MPTASKERLAIDGGAPVRTGTPPPWPVFAQDEIDAVVSVLKSGQVNQWTGQLVGNFQDAFSAWHGGMKAIAVSNGSQAIEIALRALGIGAGDEVIVPARSFVATASCVTLIGATPVFADVDLDTQLITAATIAPHIGVATRAVMPVHLNGRPCDMPAIMKLANEHGLLVIEDCAQSLGASIDGRLTGTFGHAAAFSFCQDKIVTTGGEGGMIMTSEDAVWRKAWSFKDHGKSYELAHRPNEPRYRWMHETAGTNARMTEMQAAIGCRQLTKLGGWIADRQRNAGALAAALQRFPCVRIASVPDNQVHVFYRLEFSINAVKLRRGWDRDKIIAALGAEGISAFAGVCPEIYREQIYARGSDYPILPNAHQLGAESMTLLTHPTLTDAYTRECVHAIDKVFRSVCN